MKCTLHRLSPSCAGSSLTTSHLAVNACLAPLCSMHGLAVTTTEAIGDTKTRLHPVQERLAKSHGSQCGFCTPGMVMSMYTLLRNNPCPSIADLEHTFEGNLCRCTGYRPILDAFQSFTKEFRCPMGEQCCKNQKKSDDALSERPPQQGSEFAPYDPSQEPIFPSELQLNDRFDKTLLVFSSERVTWYRPTSLGDLLTLKSTYPDSKLVIGNTEDWKPKLKNQHYPVVIAATDVPELLSVERSAAGVRLGASTTMTTLKEVLQELVSSEPEYKTRVYAAIIEMLRWFGGKQIRNVAVNSGQRTIVMDEKFFHGYRKTLVKPDEVLINVLIPFTRQNEYFYGYKQAHRREDDIAIVNAGMRVVLNDEENVIEQLTLSFGGMSPHTVMATSTAKQLIGKKWESDFVPEACDLLAKELFLPPGVPGGMESYRNTLSLSFFFKFYLTVQTKRASKQVKTTVPSSYKSATILHEREASHGSQVFEEVESGHQQIDPVGRSLPHLAATQQATGEAVYIDDIRPYAGELSLALVVSSKAHAQLISVDASDALQMPGVVDFISHKDVPGENCFGSIVPDQTIFAVDKVLHQGQIIGAVIAETRAQAVRAAKAVVVKYEELTPILTIQQAIDANSFLESDPLTIKKGDVVEGFKGSDVIVEGEMYVGGQEHFYLETHACIAVPSGEDNEMTLIASVQHLQAIQNDVAGALGVPSNRIVCKAKRLGGGFGGKEADGTMFALPLAVAANKLQRPVRISLDRDEDMIISGSRHPFLGRYKAGFSKDGLIQALEVDLYCNGGFATGLSPAVMERAVLHVENSYKIPNVTVRGYLCQTNLPSNTVFRGSGAPQSFLICENWMEQAAQKLHISCDKVKSSPLN
ncbi:Xanthine dehydrogenase/oxidase [Lamellibrachia satsuma]|nr:Xanthine dehydrogenase/oxidase [Lamellibrachia satsuma]